MLSIFRAAPLGVGTKVPQNDYWTGDGSETEFEVTAKTLTEGSGVVWVEGQQRFRSQGGFSKVAPNLVFPTAPPLGSSIIYPATIRVQIQAYDLTSIPGVTNPNIKEIAFYVGDVDTISFYTYEAAPLMSGIRVSLVNRDEDNGAETSWLYLAKALPDGNPDTYEAAGDPLYLEDIIGTTDVAVASLSGDTTLEVTDASDLINGEIIKVGQGTANEEEVQITNIVGNVLTTSIMQYDHDTAETVFSAVRKCFLKMVVPENATGGQSTNLLNISLDLLYDEVSRAA